MWQWHKGMKRVILVASWYYDLREKSVVLGKYIYGKENEENQDGVDTR
jgi:hypothetical protein